MYCIVGSLGPGWLVTSGLMLNGSSAIVVPNIERIDCGSPEGGKSMSSASMFNGASTIIVPNIERSSGGSNELNWISDSEGRKSMSTVVKLVSPSSRGSDNDPDVEGGSIVISYAEFAELSVSTDVDLVSVDPDPAP